MPHISYEHIDPTAKCPLGRRFEIFRQATAVELKHCDVCSKEIKQVPRKPNPLLDGGALGNTGTAAQQVTPTQGPTTLNG